MRYPRTALALACAVGVAGGASSREDLAPRVHPQALEAARRTPNPLEALEDLERGRALYLGKGFCATCHGRDGKGLGSDVDYTKLRGPLPRDFTDRRWQRARTDGELFWTLRNGSTGTAMAPFVPRILTEHEAWQVLLFVRALGGR